MLKGIYKEVIKDFGSRTFNDVQSRAGEIKAVDKFSVLTEDIENYIDDVTADKVVMITETTKRDIKNIVQNAVQEGQSIPQMKKAIDGLYLEKIIPNRSRTIARTEVVSASNYGSMAGAKQTSSRLKKIWIPTFDDSTRESHLSMANHPAIALDENFNVGGYYGQYPGDFSLPANEVINCRCAIGYEYAAIVQPTQTVIIDKTTELKNNIIEKNKNSFKGMTDFSDYELELKEIIDKFNEDDLILYDKLSTHVEKNIYDSKSSGAYYTSAGRQVVMNLSNNFRERTIGTNRKGEFTTKFHEEFHQLDDIMSLTPISVETSGRIAGGLKITNLNTLTGLKIKESIEKDVINVINKAIQEYNQDKGTAFKPIKNLDRISSDAKKAHIYFIKKNYQNTAQIATYSDALGGITQGRMSPFKLGLWGHTDDYYKQRGLSVAGSEVWAEYGAYRYAFNDETKKITRELMPETFKTMDIIYNDITEYVKNNPLPY